MSIKSEQIGGVLIVSPSGPIDYSSTLKLVHFVTPLFAQATTGIILDLADVDYINSAGYSILSMLFGEAKKSGVKLGICNLKELDEKNLASLNFPDLENIFPTREDAIAKFNSK